MEGGGTALSPEVLAVLPSWYFPNMNSNEAETLLRTAEAGSYLLRPSSNPKSLTLSYSVLLVRPLPTPHHTTTLTTPLSIHHSHIHFNPPQHHSTTHRNTPQHNTTTHHNTTHHITQQNNINAPLQGGDQEIFQ